MQPYYETPIDRYNSSSFNYVADTKNTELLKLVQQIWDDFSEPTRRDIDPPGPNSKPLGLVTIRVVVLQLFKLWVTDPEVCLAMPRTNNFNVNSIYNPKGISPKKLSAVFKALEVTNYIDTIPHSQSTSAGHVSTTGRCRTSKKLHQLFLEVEASEFDLFDDPNTPLIKMNKFEVDPSTGEPIKTKGKKITTQVEFDQTLPHVVQMTEVLRTYNDLLRRTHISLANVDKPYIIRTNSKGETQNIKITHASKTVRRVFSRNDWKCYGRFTGGYWQAVGDKDTDETPYRRHIRINDEATVELDYASLHPNILTVEAGLDPIEDVYTLGYKVDDQFDQTQQRLILKGLMLTLLNAQSHKAAYDAFKYDQPTGHPFKKLKKTQFNKYVEAIINKHPHLENSLGADQGIRLMFIDSQIIEWIIKETTQQNIPILTVHDSVISKETDEDYIRELMKQATKQVLGVELTFDVNRQSVPKAIASNSFRDIDFTSRLFDYAKGHEAYQSTDYHKQQWDRFKTLVLRKEG
jgi:hypothetical protein